MVDIAEQFKVLKRYAQKRGIRIYRNSIWGSKANFTWKDLYRPERSISLAHARSQEVELIHLIHELGHHEDLRFISVLDMFKSFRRIRNTSLHYKWEVRAWRRGIRLARELGIDFDRKVLARVAKRALASYANLTGAKQKEENENELTSC